LPKYFSDFSDERNKSWCYHCGTGIELAQSNREHIPTKNFLVRPFPENLPVATVCSKCNESFSLDEEYFGAFLSAVLSGTTDPASQHLEIGKNVFARNFPLRDRIERSKKEFLTIGGARKLVWEPELKRLERIIIKNAKGHSFYENGEPIFDDPDFVYINTLQNMSSEEKSAFWGSTNEIAVWPEVGSRWMQRLIEEPNFDDTGFYVVQPSVYRFRLDFEGPLTIKIVIHEYLAAVVQWD
jgi:hypothetical protein